MESVFIFPSRQPVFIQLLDPELHCPCSRNELPCFVRSWTDDAWAI